MTAYETHTTVHFARFALIWFIVDKFTTEVPRMPPRARDSAPPLNRHHPIRILPSSTFFPNPYSTTMPATGPSSQHEEHSAEREKDKAGKGKGSSKCVCHSGLLIYVAHT